MSRYKVWVYMTPSAKEQLLRDARAGGRIKRAQLNMRGLSDYLDDFVNQSLVDNRPDYAVQAGEWFKFTDQPRYRTMLSMTHSTKTKLFETAITFNIYNPGRLAAKGNEPGSIIGAVLEAMGSHWLVRRYDE